jgi:ribulose-phosphate 3-epimerase
MNPANLAIVPSYPAPNFMALRDLAFAVAPVCTELQVDIVDGQFVPAYSWPFTETSEPAVSELQHLAELPPTLTLEVDCMVREPLQYLDTLAALGARRIIIHHRSTEDYQACLNHARVNGYTVGIAVLPTVDLSLVEPLITSFDYVQVMGIKEVGKQGQPFATEALALIAAIRLLYPEKEVAVDGAVNADTIPALVAAGATRLAPGSAVVGASDPAHAVTLLQALALEHYPHTL